MTVEEDVRWVVNMLGDIAIPKGTTWCLFGSVLDGGVGASDIDLLILYRDPSQAMDVRKALSRFANERPIHLLLLTYQEDEEVGFRDQEECWEVFPVNRLLLPPDCLKEGVDAVL